MNAKLTSISKTFCMFWTDDKFNPEDYDKKYRIKRSGVGGQHRFIKGKLVDMSEIVHWIAEPEFAIIIKEDMNENVSNV